MNIYIWKSVDQCSGSYHCDGGVVVFAASEARARELANSAEDCAIKPEEMPDEVRQGSGEESVFIFPNAGCC